MLVSTVLFVLLCEFAWMRKGRYSTRPIPQRQPVSFVSLLQRTNNKYELLAARNRNTVSCMRPTSIKGAPPDL